MTRRITLVKPSDMFRMLENSMALPDNSTLGSFENKISNIEINLTEYSDRYEIEAKVPGYTKKEIDISFKDTTLIIEGAASKESKKEDGNIISQEFVRSSFKRVVTLPSKIDIDKAEAELKNGIMTINIPKLPEVLKKIDIK
jgi:HSP20 family protein